MLRSGELLGAHRDELFDLDGEHPRFDVPLKRVKKRRVIQQPLSDLAVEIIREALTSDKQQYIFVSPLGDMPMNRRVMATALRGTKYKGKVNDARHLRSTWSAALHATRSAPNGGDPGGRSRL